MSENNCYLLVVDDDDDLRESLADALADEGFRVDAACNGREALDLLRSRPEAPCLILLDVMMPVMDGYAFRAVQRADPSLAEVPVVLISAHAEGQEQTLHPSAFLRKPLSLDVLLDTARRFCTGERCA